jgi:transcriptional antiterminator RfaH
MLKWYVLYTKLHGERQVASHLGQHGYQVYLPTIPVAQPRRDRPRERPYFPGYLFLHYDLEDQGPSRIIYTPGLRGIVSFGGEPAVVSADDMAKIRTRLAQAQMWDAAGSLLRPGDTVEILQEPFTGVDAIFDRRLTPAGRVRVLLRYLEQHRLERKSTERHIPLELDEDLVRKKEIRS